MRGDEYPIDDFSLKLEDLLTSPGQLTDLTDQQVRRRYIFDLLSCLSLVVTFGVGFHRPYSLVGLVINPFMLAMP